MKILIAYDGSLNSQIALKYGLQKIRENGGEIAALHVFPVSLFIDYGAGPKAEEMARAESARYVDDAKKIISDAGSDVTASVIAVDGDPEEEIKRYAKSGNFELIISPPRYKSIVKDAPCPVSIIPGNILVPVDNTAGSMSVLEQVTEAAKATGSKVILLGIVPIHMYSKWEKKELENVKKETSAILKKIKKALTDRGLETKEIVRSGYPDEEILKVADEYTISMIIIPEGGDKPSELGKAASIILEESDSLRKPVFLVPSEKAV